MLINDIDPTFLFFLGRYRPYMTLQAREIIYMVKLKYW